MCWFTLWSCNVGPLVNLLITDIKYIPPKLQIFSRLEFLEKATVSTIYPFYEGERADTQSMVYTNGIWRHLKKVINVKRSLKLLWLLATTYSTFRTNKT
jgi:hypothetical protein